MNRKLDGSPSSQMRDVRSSSSAASSAASPAIQGAHSNAGLPVGRRLEVAHHRLVRMALAQGFGAEDAEDIAQETLLEAWRHLEDLYAPDGIDVWLNAIYRNVCRRQGRVRARRTRRELLIAPAAGAPGEQDAHVSPV